MTRPPSPAADCREPARQALDQARDAVKDAHPDDRPLVLATLATAYVGTTVASAIMTTGTRIARALEEISVQLVLVNEAIR